MKCPKCGYMRQTRDDAFVPASECPSCGIVYSKHDTIAAPPATSPPQLRPSAVDPESLKKARERVEKRLRKRMESRARDDRYEQTLELAKKITNEKVNTDQDPVFKAIKEKMDDPPVKPTDDANEQTEEPVLLDEMVGVQLHDGSLLGTAKDESKKTAKKDRSPDNAPTEVAADQKATPKAAEGRKPGAADKKAETEEIDPVVVDGETAVAENMLTEAEETESETVEAVVTETEEPEPEMVEAVTIETEEPEPETAEAVATEAEESEPETVEAVVTEAEESEPETAEAVATEAEELEPARHNATEGLGYPDDIRVETVVLKSQVERTEKSLPPDGVPETLANEVTTEDEGVELPDAYITEASNATRFGGNLTRLLATVAWLILVAGLVGAILSWTTISEVEAGVSRTAGSYQTALPLGLLLGFAYLATGALGFAFFWVSSMINRQLKDIRQILLVHPGASDADALAETRTGGTET